MRYFLILILFSILPYGFCEEIKESARIMVKDSYLEAFKQVHVPKSKPIQKIMNRDSKVENGYPASNYEPSHQYGHPVPSYGPPTPNYGVPVQNYGPPTPIYGPPAPVYGPPMTSEPSNGVPHALLGILDKIHLKLDISTILKILLKLVIFKKIVSFIALICLLLFIPKFKMDKNGEEEEEEDEMRSYLPNADQKLNNLTQVVLAAIEDYSEKNKNCDSMYCQAQRMFRNIDDKFSYDKLLTWYSKE